MRGPQSIALALACAFLAGCLQSAPGDPGVPTAETPTPREWLSFQATVHFTQVGAPVANAGAGLTDPCLLIVVPAGWVPMRMNATIEWDATPATGDLWLALWDDERASEPLSANHGPSPQSTSYVWNVAEQAHWRRAAEAQGEGVLLANPSLARTGAAAEQEVRVRADVLFLQYPEAQEQPYAAPCRARS